MNKQKVYEVYEGRRLKNILFYENNLPIEQILSKNGEDSICKKESLLITGDKSAIQWAKQQGIAVLGFQPPEQKEFLPVEYVIQSLEDVEEEYLERVYWRCHNIPWIILETERCLVREFAMEDLDDLFALYAKPGMTDFVEPLYEYQEEAEYERAYIKHRYRYYGYGMWLVFDKESGELIGRAGLEDRDYAPSDGMQLELGYMIAPEYQGKGYGSEVCRAIIDYARDYLEYDSVNCLVDEENTKSMGFLERLGFSYVGNTGVSGENMRRYRLQIQ